MADALTVLKEIKRLFEDNHIDNASNEALWLFEKVLGVDKITLMRNKMDMDDLQRDRIKKLAAKRIEGMPIQYLLGEWDFMQSFVSVGEGVLIPRDDTEVVVTSVFDFLDKTGDLDIKILDLCSGSGIIAISLKKQYKNAHVFALEKSDEAFCYLLENVKRNNISVECIKGDVFEDFNKFDDGFFDLIISNPPYIKTDEIPTLQKEVQFEPKMALDGGKDGYDFYKAIVSLWSRKLKQGGMLSFELGEGQFDTVALLMKQEGFKNIREFYDLSDVKRAINGTYLL